MAQKTYEDFESILGHSRRSRYLVRINALTFYTLPKIHNMSRISEILYEIAVAKTDLIILFIDPVLINPLFHTAYSFSLLSQDTTWITIEYAVKMDDLVDVPWNILNLKMKNQVASWSSDWLIRTIESIVAMVISPTNLIGLDHNQIFVSGENASSTR